MIEVREIESDQEFQSALENIGDMDPPGVYVDGELVAVALMPSTGEALAHALGEALAHALAQPVAPSCVECPDCGAEVDTRSARQL